MSAIIERRNVAPKDLHVEAREGSQSPVIEGYAAVFNEPTIIWDFEERIAPGAFKRTLANGSDTRALFNHDPNFILGRTTNNTLILREDSTGLWTETHPPQTPIAQSIVESVRRGDVSGMSFAFTVRKQEWIFSEDPEVLDTRVITEVGMLYDIGPVTFPAYEQTSVKVRSEAKKLHEEARSRWQEQRKTIVQVPKEFENVLRECRADEAWINELEAENEKPKTDAPAFAEAQGEAQAEPTEEVSAPAQDATTTTQDGSELPSQEEKCADAFLEALNREIAQKRAVGRVSAATRRAWKA